MSRVFVHIDKLVLRGVDRRDADSITAAIEQHLQRHLAQPGTAQHVAERGNRGRVLTQPVQRSTDQSLGDGVGNSVAASVGAGVPR